MYTTKRGKAVENHRRTRSHNIKWADWYDSGDPNYQPVYEIIPVPKPEYRPVEPAPIVGGVSVDDAQSDSDDDEASLSSDGYDEYGEMYGMNEYLEEREEYEAWEDDESEGYDEDDTTPSTRTRTPSALATPESHRPTSRLPKCTSPSTRPSHATRPV
jgi:hypothetical protein